MNTKELDSIKLIRQMIGHLESIEIQVYDKEHEDLIQSYKDYVQRFEPFNPTEKQIQSLNSIQRSTTNFCGLNGCKISRNHCEWHPKN